MNSVGDTWLVLGGASSLARAFAHEVARNGAAVILAGRDKEDLEATAADLALRHGTPARVLAFDALRTETHAAFAGRAVKAAEGRVLHVCLVFGLMPDQAEMDADPALARACIDTSFTGAVTVLDRLAPHLEAQGGGAVIGFGSVAGDRGRLKNYTYGAAKAGLHAYLQGLRARLFKAGVTVTTVKPGFTDTAMTWGLDGMFLVASPEDVAKTARKASAKGCEIVYAPGFWRAIMTVIRLIPEPIFKKLGI